MGFYRQRTKCQFLRGPTYGPANDDAGPPPWPAYFSPAANNNDAARHPSLPCRHRPAAPSNRTRPATRPAAPSNRTRPARHNRPDTASQPQPSRPTPALPDSQPHPAGRIHPVTQLAQSTQSRHLAATFSHQQRWCAKPVRPVPAQPSGAAQGR